MSRNFVIWQFAHIQIVLPQNIITMQISHAWLQMMENDSCYKPS